MVPVWLLPEESSALVPEPSSKAQCAIVSFVTCPSATNWDPTREIAAQSAKSRFIELLVGIAADSFSSFVNPKLAALGTLRRTFSVIASLRILGTLGQCA